MLKCHSTTHLSITNKQVNEINTTTNNRNNYNPQHNQTLAFGDASDYEESTILRKNKSMKNISQQTTETITRGQNTIKHTPKPGQFKTNREPEQIHPCEHNEVQN